MTSEVSSCWLACEMLQPWRCESGHPVPSRVCSSRLIHELLEDASGSSTVFFKQESQGEDREHGSGSLCSPPVFPAPSHRGLLSLQLGDLPGAEEPMFPRPVHLIFCSWLQFREGKRKPELGQGESVSMPSLGWVDKVWEAEAKDDGEGLHELGGQQNSEVNDRLRKPVGDTLQPQASVLTWGRPVSSRANKWHRPKPPQCTLSSRS